MGDVNESFCNIQACGRQPKKKGGGGFFPAFGALAKINVFPFVTCADLKKSKKKCGILMIERRNPGMGLALPHSVSTKQ